MWSIVLRANMGIRAHPRLANDQTSNKGHIGTQSLAAPGRPFVHLLIPSRRLGRKRC